ncbi:alpha/beta fold hydrolase [Paracoccus benzoatiresistens]|uniref:Alpha/beta fold hydrolase n=1 Tax=Paracoccus benzoatiresistens TaxID=2997341 RepID=A0ABT4J7S1_9RHOB|nr:alpha/beta fold hydrolase [Paracoccus sp. EF6]MCZ0963175.1 alpha/beta fold hydrolase [Paracoccus sp. EF6]
MRKVISRYATSGGARIAYQTVGNGSLDVVLVPGFPSNIEILWEDPGFGHLVKRLAAFCRLILLDPRGMGLSDGIDSRNPPDARGRAADILAVMDAAGSGRAALIGASDGAAAAMLAAAMWPSRCRALVLHGGYACFLASVMDAKALQAFASATEGAWGTGATLARLAPRRAADRALVGWWGRLERLSASPTAAAALVGMWGALDVRDSLPSIAVPALVLHRTGDAHVPVESSRALARGIPGARLVELPGEEHPIWMGDVDAAADAIEQFLTGEKPVAHGDRMLAALLVLRVLGMSSGAGRTVPGRHLGERMELFRDALPPVVARHGGHARWTRPDQAHARFPAAARAASCAVALRETAASLGLWVAQGIHVGEIDPSPEDLSGPVLDVADRIAARGSGPEILLSRLASELVSGSGLQFVDRGALAGIDCRAPLPLVAIASERHLEPRSRTAPRAANLDALTPREREVLALVADGLSNPHIAVDLGLSEHTVKRHVANILLKLDLPSRAAVAGLAARRDAP